MGTTNIGPCSCCGGTAPCSVAVGGNCRPIRGTGIGETDDIDVRIPSGSTVADPYPSYCGPGVFDPPSIGTMCEEMAATRTLEYAGSDLEWTKNVSYSTAPIFHRLTQTCESGTCTVICSVRVDCAVNTGGGQSTAPYTIYYYKTTGPIDLVTDPEFEIPYWYSTTNGLDGPSCDPDTYPSSVYLREP